MDIGLVQRIVGMGGDLYVELFSQEPHRYQGKTQFLLGEVPYEVERSSPRGKGILLKLKGVDSAEAAGALRGAMVRVPEADIAALAADTYYHFQIIG
ncbi:MAG: Ribosome maturation factor RimM, partial [Dehalococcoidia bacterium]|nr:Ribosome maturation factor RimM [Dehalococcoidia bacterium]